MKLFNKYDPNMSKIHPDSIKNELKTRKHQALLNQIKNVQK